MPDLLGTGLMGTMAVFMLWLVTTDWLGARPRQQFSVDGQLTDKFQVNFDISVATRCDSVGIILEDVSGDRLFVDELISVGPDSHTPLLLGFPEQEWCRFTGSFETNRVQSRLVVAPPVRSMFSNMKTPEFNTSHLIYELSFGKFFPQQQNPLDHTLSVMEPGSAQLYMLSLISTTAKALGVELDTYQYSVTQKQEPPSSFTSPGIGFMWDFDAIHVTISDSRLSFFGWLARVANILGGVTMAARWFSQWRLKNGIIRDEKEGLLT